MPRRTTESVHPLRGNSKWQFNQPDLGFRANYVAVELEVDEPEREVIALETSNSCREGIINNARSGFQTRLTNMNQVTAGVGRGERVPWKALRGCDLVDPAGKQDTYLKIQWHKGYMGRDREELMDHAEFLRVCDVVMGPVCVLLGPNRPSGDKWWRTDPEQAIKKKGDQIYICWNGTDNWFLAHPATLAIATGLYRQCFHLCLAGVADEVIGTLSEEEVAEVMSTNSQKLALQLVKKTRPWIEVPVGTNGYRANYAFAFGFWRRLIRLQRAIRRVGYEETLGQSFHEGWSTVGGNDAWRGTYTFWGDEDGLTDHHRHLMKIGAPKRRITGGKSAAKASR